MRAALRGAAAGIAIFAGLAACGPANKPPVDVAIRLIWNTDGVPIADGHATFATDLGYAVDVDRFEVTAYSVELVPCDPLPVQPPMPQKQSFSFIGTAWAGHRIGHPPTLTSRSRVETPLAATTIALEQLKVPDVAYCSGHYLIARLPDPPSDPADAGSLDVSLRVHGRFHKGDGVWSEFTVQTPVSHGVVADFKPEGKKGIGLKSGDVIVVSHRLEGAFNGVDFAAMPENEVARQILRQIVAGTSVTHEKLGAAG